MHVSFVIRSNHNPLGDAVSSVHQLNISDSDGQVSVSKKSHSKHNSFGLSSLMAHTDIQTMHEETGMMNLPGSPTHATLSVRVDLPQGGLWKGQCHRLLLHFSSSDGKDADVRLVPFLGAGMHVFIAQNSAVEEQSGELIHAHGFPAEMDASMSKRAEDTGGDMCIMDSHSIEDSDSTLSFDPHVVMYVRFAKAGPYALFVQVSIPLTTYLS